MVKKKLSSRFLLNREKTVAKYNRNLTDEEQVQRQNATKKKIKKLKNKFAKYNIDYDVDKVVPESLKGPLQKNKALKSETEESDSDMDDSLDPEQFGFVANSDEDSDGAVNELDSDVSDEPNPILAQTKKKKSLVTAKQASKKLLEATKTTKKQSKGKIEQPVSPVVMKKDRKKLVGITKKLKKPTKTNDKSQEKMKKAFKETVMKESNQVKLIQKKAIKSKKAGKK